MAKKLDNYLRTYRRKAGLSQEDVAYLLGAREGGKISRYERGSRVPNFRTVLALEAVFRVPVRQLFAGKFHGASGETARRARLLIRKLRMANGGRQHSRKLDTLRRIASGSVTKSV